MSIQKYNSLNTSFRANPLVSSAAFLDSRVLMNKAVLDASLDVPMVLMANNPVERKEKLNRALIPWIIAYATPFITLPLTNRLAMKHIASLSKFSADESKLILISNKYLTNPEKTKRVANLLSKKLNFDISKVMQKCGGDYNVLRKKIINAKTAVACFDYAFTATPVSLIGFYNNAKTKYKTGQEGFSAEFQMADKTTVEKRAQKFKKTEKARKLLLAGVLTALTLLPLLVRKSILTSNSNKLLNIVKNNAAKFDYKDGIFIGRFPFFLSAVAIYTGLVCASRNETELKEQTARAAVSLSAFFGGDILIKSTLSRLSDKYLKTNLLKNTSHKTLMNKIIPPTRNIENLTGRSKKIGGYLFWTNMAALTSIIGFGTPYLLNKMIRKDVSKEIKTRQTENFKVSNKVFKDFNL